MIEEVKVEAPLQNLLGDSFVDFDSSVDFSACDLEDLK